jgi:SAM-dependent methyltransferase
MLFGWRSRASRRWRTVLESDQFYNAIAADYALWSQARQQYLSTVDGIVTEHSPRAARMLDVGSGDGLRAHALADRIGAAQLTMMDNSEAMLARCREVPGARVVRGDIADPGLDVSERFEVVTCVGNVLGHVGAPPRRATALANLAQLMAPDARLILDVHNRWNVRAYGWRAWRNVVRGNGDRPGDFPLVPAFSQPVATRVHLFAPGELDRRFREHGLQVAGRYVVDYSTGARRRTVLEGQLIYVLATTRPGY